ncbi:MAG: hypothetical protein K2J96_06100, partial [Bacteroidaceae bacterium]|nr:hypothetical protein [Bacteroidaceae bacterium]
YPTFSPLPFGGSFLLHRQVLADFFPLGSGLLSVARTFLFPLFDSGQRQAGRLTLFPDKGTT